LFTFRALCASLLLAAVQSRSSTRLLRWLRRYRLSGLSIPASEIASQRSKDKCGSISIFSLGTKMFDTQVDSRVPFRPSVRFRSFPPSVGAESILVMRNQRQDEYAPITKGMKAAGAHYSLIGGPLGG